MFDNLIIPIAIVSAIGLIAGVGLSVATMIFHKPSDPREEELRSALPGANCGACGFTGCDGYAQALAGNQAAPNLCTPGGAATQSRLAEILGVEAGDYRPTAAFVKCNGQCAFTSPKMTYTGAQTCYGAAQIFGGPEACQFGCMGYGDCAAACAYDAIHIHNGVAVVDPKKCVGCLKCIAACPKKLISMQPAEKTALVACGSHDRGAAVRKICSVGCIACSKCVKDCPVQAITMDNFLAVVDPKLCTNCGTCITSCPQKCILERKSAAKSRL